MPKFKILFRFSILSCILTLLVNSLYSHQIKRIASNSTNIHYNNICCNEYNNFNNKNIFEKHWLELDIRSFYKTTLSIYQGICLKIYDSCGKSFHPINVQQDNFKRLFEMDYYFDPYFNPDEPFYYIQTYLHDDPIKKEFYSFCFSDTKLGVQPFHQSDTIWFEWDQVKKTLTDKEIFLLEAMRSTGFLLFNDLFPFSEELHLEMNLHVKNHLVNETYYSQDSIKITNGKLYLLNIRCEWIDTNSTLQPEKYYSSKNIETRGSCYGLGIIINSKSSLISEGIYFMKYDQYIYPIIGNIQVYGLNVPIDYLDELLTSNL